MIEGREAGRRTMPLEMRLADSLVNLSSRYAEAIRVMEPLSGEVFDPSERDRRIERVQSLLSHIATLETQSRPLRVEWMNSGRRPGPDLQRAIDAQERLITTLLSHVQSCERRLASERTRLIPAVDAEVRRHDMQAAYARHR